MKNNAPIYALSLHFLYYYLCLIVPKNVPQKRIHRIVSENKFMKHLILPLGSALAMGGVKTFQKKYRIANIVLCYKFAM
jgi:hypothetical protein